MELWMVVILAVLLEWTLHYFPWKLLLKGKELSRVMAYTLGTLGLMLPYTAWLWYRNDVDAIIALWSVVAAGGFTVVLLYRLDRHFELEMRNLEAEERERAERERHAKN